MAVLTVLIWLQELEVKGQRGRRAGDGGMNGDSVMSLGLELGFEVCTGSCVCGHLCVHASVCTDVPVSVCPHVCVWGLCFLLFGSRSVSDSSSHN